MRSFAILSAVAAFAFSAVSAIPHGEWSHNKVANANINALNNHHVSESRDVNVGVHACLGSFRSDISEAVVSLQHVTSQNCTTEAIAPVVALIHDKTTHTVSVIAALAGQGASAILCKSGSTVLLTVSELAVVIGDLVCFILAAVAAVITVAGANLSVVAYLLSSILADVSALIAVCVHVCAPVAVGIAAAIWVNISVAVNVVACLGVASIKAAVGLSVSL